MTELSGAMQSDMSAWGVHRCMNRDRDRKQNTGKWTTANFCGASAELSKYNEIYQNGMECVYVWLFLMTTPYYSYSDLFSIFISYYWCFLNSTQKQLLEPWRSVEHGRGWRCNMVQHGATTCQESGCIDVSATARITCFLLDFCT